MPSIEILKLTGMLASFISAFLSTGKRNLSFYTVTAAGALALTGSGLLSSVGHGVNLPNYLYGYEVIFGLGLGGLLISPILNIGLNTREEDTGTRSSTLRGPCDMKHWSIFSCCILLLTIVTQRLPEASHRSPVSWAATLAYPLQLSSSIPT